MPASPGRTGADSGTYLLFLEGLRGVAAVYVLLHHASLMVPPHDLAWPAAAVRFLLRHGHAAVAVFIILSGYCLTLPVARSANGCLRNGFTGYLVRRARRIVPPYYAALLLGVLLIPLVPALAEPSQARWDRALPVTGQGTLFSHLLLVHNLSERWLYKIDPPMWSVATEWQIYLLFPALLVVWRRVGTVATVAIGFAAGYAIAALSVPAHSLALRYLCPWYLGLFTLGMAAAGRPSSLDARADDRAWRRVLTAGLVVLALVLAGVAFSQYQDQNILLSDAIVGAVTARLIVRWRRLSQAGVRRPILRFLEARSTVALGAFSYSLYLTHYPLLALADAYLRAGGWGPEGRLAILLLGASPLCLIVAAGFFRLFERPFLVARSADEHRSAGASAAGSVAPGRTWPAYRRTARTRLSYASEQGMRLE